MGPELLAVWCAACCAAVAVWMLHRQDEALRRARLLFAAPGGTGLPRAGVRWHRSAVRAAGARWRRARRWLEGRLGARVGSEAWCVPAGVALALAARSPLPALAGLLAVPFVRRRLRTGSARAARDRREEEVAGLCAALAGELRAGRPPQAALAEAVQRSRSSDRGGDPGGRLTPLLAAARFGGDVPAALRRAAVEPGLAGLSGVAACWEVAVDGGAGLADGLDRVAAALRADRDRRADLRAQLAGPRATAGMLALLPAFAVLLGVLLGADPLRVLFHTPAGGACLLAGAALEWAGLLWTERIVRSAEEA